MNDLIFCQYQSLEFSCGIFDFWYPIQIHNYETNIMTRILTLTIAALFSVTVYGQDPPVSRQDSVLLNKFWTELRVAVNTKDKAKLATLFAFPFYCRPCIDDTTLKVNDGVTIKVTKALFYESQYKLFFDKAFKTAFNIFEPSHFFRSYDNKNKPNGFNFFYVIVAPSSNWEGLQGFVYLENINGQYKIVAIDTVP